VVSRTVDLLVLRQALFDLFRCGNSLILLRVVGASGFEPPTSWSRTTRIKIGSEQEFEKTQ
jgi:hypothetical protein